MHQEVMRNKNISPEAKAIYAYLSSIAGLGQTCYPSLDTMQVELAMSKGRLTKYLGELIACGVVEKKREMNGNLYGRNVYKVTHEAEVAKDMKRIFRAVENRAVEDAEVENRAVENLTANNNNTNNNSINNNSINKKSSRFTPPTVEEVAAYCKERGNNVDAESFVNFYESKNWMIGKNKMKNWKAAVITWEKREAGSSQPKPVKTQFHNFAQREYEKGTFDKLFENQ